MIMLSRNKRIRCVWMYLESVKVSNVEISIKFTGSLERPSGPKGEQCLLPHCVLLFQNHRISKF